MRICTVLHRFALFLALGVLWTAFPGAVAGALAQEVHNPDGVAVIIGNRNYQHRDVPEVTFAHEDADAFRRYVIDVLGFDPENIIDLRDATRGDLVDALGSRTNPKDGLLWSFLNPEGGSDVVVFYSGHGVPGLKDKRGYLLPVDTRPKQAELDGYPIDLLYKNVGGLAEAETVQVYLDACFSGGSAGGAVITDASPVFVTASLPAGVEAKVVSLTAASEDQLASWDKEKKQGLFTHHLLKALYGGGDADGDGRVTASEAKAYLDKYMTRAARRQHRRTQKASLLGTDTTVLVDVTIIVELPDVDSPDVETPDVETPEVTGGGAILTVETDPPGATVLLGVTKVGKSPLSLYDLSAGTYTVTLDHPTYETVILEGQVLVDKRVLDIRRALQPATGDVTVITRPSGGWVEHDGERVADSTPVELKGLPSGSMVLTLGAAGHRPVEVEVQVPKGGVALVDRALEEIEFGTLTLVLEPADARVTLTDGDATYQAGMRLADGEHRVRVTREGYQEVSRVVSVSGDTRARIVLEPVKPQEVDTVPEPSAEPSAPTLEALESSLGLNRDELRRIQRNLISLGFYAGTADGLFGQLTRQALKTWQSSQKMAATGYLDADSAKALLAVQPETSITVRTVPPNAEVRVFTASGSEYRDGMLVKPGEYEIAVDAPNHESFRQALYFEGPAEYRISLCRLESRTQRVCEDKPIDRSRSVQNYQNKRLIGREVRSFESLFGSLINPLIWGKGLAKTMLRQVCVDARNDVKRDLEKRCKGIEGKIDRTSFRITQERCDIKDPERIALVEGSMACKVTLGVVEESYTEIEEECRNVVEEVRNCPDEMVTRLH